ncbi:hypothetical protein C8F01DRAFT_1224603 [Mycena amicta]|nr:hypothetical protein C8F01DRAFT_1224603 [Mycena amicta]
MYASVFRTVLALVLLTRWSESFQLEFQRGRRDVLRSDSADVDSLARTRNCILSFQVLYAISMSWLAGSNDDGRRSSHSVMAHPPLQRRKPLQLQIHVDALSAQTPSLATFAELIDTCLYAHKVHGDACGAANSTGIYLPTRTVGLISPLVYTPLAYTLAIVFKTEGKRHDPVWLAIRILGLDWV